MAANIAEHFRNIYFFFKTLLLAKIVGIHSKINALLNTEFGGTLNIFQEPSYVFSRFSFTCISHFTFSGFNTYLNSLMIINYKKK